MLDASDLTKEDWIDIGKRIRTRRKELNVTQCALAENVNISTNHMSAIERGVQCPSVNTLKKICEALDVTMDSFMQGNMHAHNVSKNLTDQLSMCQNETILIIQEITPLIDKVISNIKKVHKEP